MGLPGVNVGPLDPDRTSSFGHVGKGQTARQLVRLHTQLHPPQLTVHLARPLHEPHTDALDYDEVRDYLTGLERENGDPVIPENAEVVGATVRGEKSRGYVLTFTYRMPSGRTGKWYAPYSRDVLPGSFEKGLENVRIKEMTSRGIASFDTEGTQTEVLRRQLADSRREAAALRAHVEGGQGEVPDAPDDEGSAASDLRLEEGVRAELEEKRRENEELRQRLAALEALSGSQAAGGGVPTEGASELLGSDASTAAQDEPLEGYDNLNAVDVANRLKDSDRATVEQVLEYERSHQNRATVTKAAEAVLDRQD